MKILVTSILALLLLTIPFVNTVNAQIQFLEDVQVSSCASSGGCEVVVKQYTGIYTHYSIDVRCMDSAGNFGSFERWEYNGIYPGSACNGEI